MNAEPTTIFRAVIRPLGIATVPLVVGPFRADRGTAEVDRIRFLKDRAAAQALPNAKPEVYEIQLLPAFELEDGIIAVAVVIEGS